jgi:hypothetical protein
MIIRRTSPYSGKEFKMEIDITEQQLRDFYDDKSGLIQDAFPHLTADEREFIISGIHPAEWDMLFGEMNEDL